MARIDRLQEWALGRLARLDPARREVLLAALFLLVLEGVGMVGYAAIEGWPLVDGFYMTFITLTTIGFTEVHTLSTPGRFFTILIGLSGIGTVAFIAARTAQIVLSGQGIRERHVRKQIEHMDDHDILCGYGRIGKRIAQDLLRAGRPFLVIDRDVAEIEDLRGSDLLYVQGDAEEEETLRAAGIERARNVILTLPEDSANVFITLMARELNPNLFILTRMNHHKNRRKLLHAGADKVISPDEIGADRMAQVLLRPHVDQFMEQVLQTGPLGLLIEEVEVEAGAPLAGRSLGESNFRQQFDAMVIAIINAGARHMKFNPSPHDVIREGDILIVLGSEEMIRRLRQQGCQTG